MRRLLAYWRPHLYRIPTLALEDTTLDGFCMIAFGPLVVFIEDRELGPRIVWAGKAAPPDREGLVVRPAVQLRPLSVARLGWACVAAVATAIPLVLLWLFLTDAAGFDPPLLVDIGVGVLIGWPAGRLWGRWAVAP